MNGRYILTRQDMSIQWHQGEEQRGVRYARIWFEDCDDAKKTGDHEKWLLAGRMLAWFVYSYAHFASPDPYAQADNIRRHVQPEDSQKELSERVEHFDEEVPPESDIGRQIG